ncbi:MAG: glycosyltransferase, partial [Planctomycetaceae bacterium]
ELIEPGQTGWVCPPQDPAGLATAQSELLRDAEQGRRLGEAGRRRVEERFTWDRMAAQYESLYLELLGRPTA